MSHPEGETGGAEGNAAANTAGGPEDPASLLLSNDSASTTSTPSLGVSADSPLLMKQRHQYQQTAYHQSLNLLEEDLPNDLGASFDHGEDSTRAPILYSSDEEEEGEVYQSPAEDEELTHATAASNPFDHSFLEEASIKENMGDDRVNTTLPSSSPFGFPPRASPSGRSRSLTENVGPSYPSLSTASSSSQRLSRRTRLGTTTTPSIISTSTSSAGTSNSGSLRRPRPGTATNTLSTTPESPGLRASLDAGMAAVRRWISSRGPPPPSPSVRWRSAPTTTRSSSVGGTAASDPSVTVEEADLLLLELGLPPPPPALQHQQHPRLFQSARQRAQSEPDANSLRNFVTTEVRQRRRQSRRRRRRAHTVDQDRQPSSPRPQLSSSAAAALYTTQSSFLNRNTTTAAAATPARGVFDIEGFSTPGQADSGTVPAEAPSSSRMLPNAANTPTAGAETVAGTDHHSEASVDTVDAERRRRLRWIQINRRFQFVITMVALLFSLLLFAILICWVVFTSAYVVSFDKPCDVPLKSYFWLVTLQLVLDVFRSDIMRWVFHWDANSHQRIPCRVIIYNVAYLLYALLALRLGIRSVFVLDGSQCRNTAPELYKTSVAFVTLSIAAWSTIVCGYLLPFCVVAALLTFNGYNPSASSPPGETGGPQPVFPAAYSTSGAPPGCVEQLPVVSLDRFPADYPRECCICMEIFGANDIVVETVCQHVFHKQCCREWLRQARTCPVCRTDIPTTLEHSAEDNELSSNRRPPAGIPMGPTGRPVRGLLRMLQTQSTTSQASVSSSQRHLNNDDSSLAVPTESVIPDSLSQLDVEEGRRFGI